VCGALIPLAIGTGMPIATLPMQRQQFVPRQFVSSGKKDRAAIERRLPSDSPIEASRAVALDSG
jgi:hypothetical protein